MAEAITAEAAQANLERKREQATVVTPPISPSDTKAVLDDVLGRVMSKKETESAAQEDTDELRRAAEDQRRRDKPESTLDAIGIGRRHIACSFDTYQGKEKVVEACRNLVLNPVDMVLTGAPGTGKTHLAVSVLRELVRESKVKDRSDARFVPVPELLAEIRACYRDGGPDERDIMDKYSRLPYLVLDDLGAEKTTEWSITTLYLIIDRRYRGMLPTIVTTNLSLGQIADVLSDRISSRLAAGKVITLKGEDYRTRRTA